MPEEGNSIEKMEQLDEEQLQDLYAWLDEIPLSRAKRNVARDFSDGGKLVSLVDGKATPRPRRGQAGRARVTRRTPSN